MGMIRKVMELSMMCGLNISMVISDPRRSKNVTTYQSSPEFTLEKSATKVREAKKVESYYNSSYEKLTGLKISEKSKGIKKGKDEKMVTKIDE